MVIQTLVFYLFATMTVASAVMVISSKNPVHSVLFLMFAFFNAAGLFVLLGAEFLAMILVVVYVGAVAVLFLFVVMMLDIHVEDMRKGFLQYLPISGLAGLVFLIEILMVVAPWTLTPDVTAMALAPIPPLEQAHNTQALGQVLYTQYALLFQAAGMILLLAMVGAIVLTLRQRSDVRRQDSAKQVSRTRDEAVEIKKVESGSGI